MLSRIGRAAANLPLARTATSLLLNHADHSIPYYPAQSFRFKSDTGLKEDSQMQESHDDFKPVVKEHDLSDIESQIQKWIDDNAIVLFMKGTPKLPRCGFSNYVVGVLKFYGVEYKSVNILESEILRNAMKQYSNWPTFPQVYIKGTFVGGCDIVKEMHRDGSLEELLMKENLLK